MIKKIYLFIISIVLCISLSANIITVPHDYTDIQIAIDSAFAGDTVLVDEGLYVENIVISTPITLTSLCGRENTLIEAADQYDDCIKVFADSTLIEGFSIYGVNKPLDHKSGIFIDHADYCTVRDNRLGFSYGFSNNYGIKADHCDYLNIYDNIAGYNYTGIAVGYSEYVTVENNTCNHNSGYGIIVTTSNYAVAKNNACVDATGGLHLFDSDSCYVQDNAIEDMGYSGLSVRHGDYNVISSNTVSDCIYGVLISWLGNNGEYYDNVIEDNSYGMYLLDDCSANEIYHNSFSGNIEVEMKIEDSDSNYIYANDYCSSPYPVNSNSNNIWHSPEEIPYTYSSSSYYGYVGNYWGDWYMGYDADGDGIGELPFNLPPDENNDEYPLMESYEMYELYTSIDPQPNDKIVLSVANPTSSTVSIYYFLKDSGRVKISAYNIKGQLVENIENANMPSGNHAVNWESNLTPGIYFLSLRSTRQRIVKKITVLE